MSESPARNGGLVNALWRIATGKASLTILDQGVVSLANFATSIILGRLCSQEEFSLYGLGFTIVIAAMNAQNALITSAYTVFSPRLKGRERAVYTGSTLIHQISLACLCATGLFAGAGALSLGAGPAGLSPMLAVLGIMIPFIIFREYARQVSFAGLQTHRALLVDGSVMALQLAGLFTLGLLGYLTARNAYLYIGIATGLIGFGWLWLTRREFAPSPRSVWPDFRKDWTFSKWIFAQSLIYIVSNQIYPWLLVWFHGSEANAQYLACANVVFFANPFIIGLGNFLGPKTAHAYAEGGPAEVLRVTRRATLFFGVVMGVFVLAMFGLGDWLTVLLFKKEYAGLGMIVGLLAMGQWVWSLTTPANYGLNALERPDVAFKSLLISAAVTCTGGIVLVKLYGPAGVAWGLLAGNIAACLFTRLVFARQVHKRIREAAL